MTSPVACEMIIVFLVRLVLAVGNNPRWHVLTGCPAPRGTSSGTRRVLLGHLTWEGRPELFRTAEKRRKAVGKSFLCKIYQSRGAQRRAHLSLRVCAANPRSSLCVPSGASGAGLHGVGRHRSHELLAPAQTPPVALPARGRSGVETAEVAVVFDRTCG